MPSPISKNNELVAVSRDALGSLAATDFFTCERFMRSIKEEVLNWMIFMGKASLR